MKKAIKILKILWLAVFIVSYIAFLGYKKSPDDNLGWRHTVYGYEVYTVKYIP